MDKQKIMNSAGFAGGGLFFVLNILTQGKVPGGFVGGILGYFIGAGLAFFVLSVISPDSDNTDKTKKTA